MTPTIVLLLLVAAVGFLATVVLCCRLAIAVARDLRDLARERRQGRRLA